jgi:prepilin-type N-terminal cleavage/methylation domain-containing protein
MHTGIIPQMKMKAGFTLIELSIVLVIIGLIIGGILVGQNLINAAAIVAQISQMEKYNTAVYTFINKYGYLPGDVPDPIATRYGLNPRGQYAGEGDGNGLLEGVSQDAPASNSGVAMSAGETAMFWVDLSSAQLIDGGFTTASSTTPPASNYITLTSSPNLQAYFPAAKIGQGNYVYVYSGGWKLENITDFPGDGNNYFGISAVSILYGGSDAFAGIGSKPALTVQQAYSIDTKVDDGLPQSGSVQAIYDAGFAAWASGDSSMGAFSIAGGGLDPGFWGPTTRAVPYAPTNCYDNNGVAGPQQYSLVNSNSLNCALSLQFQF